MEQSKSKKPIEEISASIKELSADIKTIRNFVDNQLLARDSRELRNYVAKIQPNVDLTFEYESKNGDLKKATIPVGLNFFWPDASV